MLKTLLFALIYFCGFVYGQYNLNFFLNKAFENSPQIKNYSNLFLMNDLQTRLDEAENSALQIYLSGNYLFAPYFNNKGRLISTNPLPDAIGYDVGITNGGEYSALINFDKNIFNGPLLDALKMRRQVQRYNYQNKLNEEKHFLTKQVTDQYLTALQNLWLYKLSQEVSTNLEAQLKITGDLVSNGLAKIRDYLLLKVELNTQQINLNQTWQNYQEGLFQLYSICGIKDTQTVMIDSVDLQISFASNTSEFLKQYYIDSLTIEAEKQAYDTRYLPQIKLFFNTGLNAVEIDNIQRRFGLSAGVNFSLPIFDGGQKDLTRQQSEISQRINVDFRNFAEKNISLQRNNAQNKINSLRRNIDSFKNQIKDYKKLLSLSLNELQKGTLTTIEYLTELRNYTDIQKNYISTEINYQFEINNYNYWNW